MLIDQRTLLERLQAELTQADAANAPLIVAVSGGADSLALLRGVCLLRGSLQLAPLAVHVNHQLRGQESDQDANWVGDVCRQLDVPCEIATANVSEQAAARGIGIEEAARDARYDILQATAERHGVNIIALAHTADDQVETVLHHLLRGTGLAGLRGMTETRPLSDRVRLIRPLLSVWRDEIERFLRSLGQDFRCDSSNNDTSLTRNFLRHELLPLIERRLNPQVRVYLLRLAHQAADWHEALQFSAAQLLEAALLDESPTTVRLRCEPFVEQPRHLVREAFVVLWSRHEWPRQAMTFPHWDALAEMAQAGETSSLNLPTNVMARRRGKLIEIDISRQSQRGG